MSFHSAQDKQMPDGYNLRDLKVPNMRLCISMTAAIVAGAGLLSACTTNTAQEEARREYERSVADYENCVAANQMSTCERERRIMRANKRALSAATQGSRR